MTSFITYNSAKPQIILIHIDLFVLLAELIYRTRNLYLLSGMQVE